MMWINGGWHCPMSTRVEPRSLIFFEKVLDAPPRLGSCTSKASSALPFCNNR